jgi:uncharacterized membrane protein
MKRVDPVIVGVLLLSAARVATAAGQYVVTSIDYPGFRGTTIVTGTNDAGRIVGGFSVPGTAYAYGFSELAGKYSLLPSAPCQRSRCETTPLAINSRGDVAGEFSDDLQHRAVFVIRKGALQLINVPSSSDLALLGGLNERGDVVGYFQTDSGVVRMFLYSGTTVSQPPVPADFVDVAPKGINNSGQITGIYDDARGLHGFVAKRGKFTRIDVPGALATSPAALNDPGDVVGSYSVAVQAGVVTQRGFLFARGRLANIDVPGGMNTLPGVLNNAGTIAGTFEDPALPAPFNTAAFVLEHGKYTRLPLPGAAESVAGISASGEVIGTYFDPGCPVSCSVHGFRAAPTAGQNQQQHGQFSNPPPAETPLDNGNQPTRTRK